MQELYDHINKFTDINKNEFQEISSFFETKSFNKKDVLYKAGDKSLKHYFVLEGCVHMYFINEQGTRQTIQFAIKDWWITDNLAFLNNKRSEFYIQAVKPSVIIQIGYKKQEALLLQFPKMETYFRKIYQTAYGASLMRMKYIYGYSKEEIYFHFRDSFPHFVNNVPQYLVASYLGLSPEYVSKLRRKGIS